MIATVLHLQMSKIGSCYLNLLTVGTGPKDVTNLILLYPINWCHPAPGLFTPKSTFKWVLSVALKLNDGKSLCWSPLEILVPRHSGGNSSFWAVE